MITVDALHRRWGDFALENVSLTVPAHEYLVILGPCGSGKTLLLETIAGLYEVDHGRIAINERDVTRLPPETRRVSLLYQQYALFPHLSIRANIAYGLRYLGLSRSARTQRVDEMIDLLEIQDLAGRGSPNALSGGEAQKVALARALAIRPEALLLDEPLSSLDPRAGSRVLDILSHVHAQLRIPIIHVTHDYSEAAALADRVGVMSAGRLAQIGSVHDVFRHPATRFVADFIGAENVLEAAILRTTGEGTRLRVGKVELDSAHMGCSDPAAMCIRPDDIAIHPRAPARPNILPATVRELRHQGFTVRIDTATDAGDIIVIVSENEFADLAVTIGSRVHLELRPDRIHVMSTEGNSHAA